MLFIVINLFENDTNADEDIQDVRSLMEQIKRRDFDGVTLLDGSRVASYIAGFVPKKLSLKLLKIA